MNTLVFYRVSNKSWKYKAKSIVFNKSRQAAAANVFDPSRARNVSRIMFAGPVELRCRDSNKSTTNERLCSIIRGGPLGHPLDVVQSPYCVIFWSRYLLYPFFSPVHLLCHFIYFRNLHDNKR